MLDQTYYKKADEIISQHGLEPASLIPIIQDIQSEYRSNLEEPSRRTVAVNIYFSLKL